MKGRVFLARIAWALAGALVLSACSDNGPNGDKPYSDCVDAATWAQDIRDATGAGEDIPPVQLELQGQLFAEFRQGTACLDLNRNLRCDEGEPASEIGSEGRYQLSYTSDMPIEDAWLVAELRSPFTLKASAPLVMLAPPHAGGISALTSLWALTSDSVSDPTRQLDQLLAQLSVFDAPPRCTIDKRDGVRPWEEVGGPLEQAWVEGMTVPTVRPEYEEDLLARAMTLAPALTSSLTRYLDEDGALFAGISARTLFLEGAAEIIPVACQPFESIPVLNIETEGRAPIVSKDSEDYLDARLWFGEEEGDEEGAVTLEIKGRGNSTWEWPKKPYRLKLTERAPLLGMSHSKHWVLLANYADKTLLRNSVAGCIANILGMDATPHDRQVELVLNGRYNGVYTLTENIRIERERLDLGVMTGGLEKADPDDGFWVEIDRHVVSRPERREFWFESSAGIPIAIRSKGAQPQAQAIEGFMNGIEALFDGRPSTEALVEQVQLETAVDYYLLQELTKNVDAFYSSTFLHRRRGGRLRFGPMWDFDLALGNASYYTCDDPKGLWLQKDRSGLHRYNAYILALFRDPVFAKMVAARWSYLSSRMPEVYSFIDESAEGLMEAQARNFERWDIMDREFWWTPIVVGSYEGEVLYLRSWLQTRVAWLDGAIPNP